MTKNTESPFSVGCNLPGMAPEHEIRDFASFAEAADYQTTLMEDMGGLYAEGDEFGDCYYAMAQALRLEMERDPLMSSWQSEDGDGYVYWIKKRE